MLAESARGRGGGGGALLIAAGSELEGASELEVVCCYCVAIVLLMCCYCVAIVLLMCC